MIENVDLNAKVRIGIGVVCNKHGVELTIKKHSVGLDTAKISVISCPICIREAREEEANELASK